MLNKFRSQSDISILPEKNRIYMKPHVLLRPYIAHYTLYYPEQNAEPELRIIPDGSGCIVISCRETGDESHFIGASTTTSVVQNGEQPPHFFIEFRAGGAYRFLSLPHSELRDKRILLEECLPDMRTELLHILAGSTHINDLIDRLDQLFLRRMENRPDLHPVVLAALSGNASLLSPKALEAELHYSQRHIRRIFCSQTGMVLKTYSEIIRINTLLKQMHGKSRNLTELALEQSYYDQPHFNHSFKKICGVSPTSYMQNMSAFYKEPLKF